MMPVVKSGYFTLFKNKKMAKAKKEGKPKRNRANLVKKQRVIENNHSLISKFYENLEK
jgi:hypothetical protein